ncbi:MAG: hypothetical protein WCJ29_00035 [bacterium]
MTYLGLKTALRAGVEVFVFRNGEISHSVFPEIESDVLLTAINNVAQPEELSGVVVLQSPGTFSAIRSAVVTANGIAVARNIPVVGEEYSEDGTKEAFEHGIKRLEKGENQFPLAPHYDREPNITLKKE